MTAKQLAELVANELVTLGCCRCGKRLWVKRCNVTTEDACLTCRGAVLA